MSELRSSESEVTTVRRLGIVPALLTQNILYRGEGGRKQPLSSCTLTHTDTHRLVPLCEN